MYGKHVTRNYKVLGLDKQSRKCENPCMYRVSPQTVFSSHGTVNMAVFISFHHYSSSVTKPF